MMQSTMNGTAHGQEGDDGWGGPAPFAPRDLVRAQRASAIDQRELVTVVVPVYNAAAHLRRCLESIARQTYANLQVVCVDDGSTDRSPGILSAYAEADCRFSAISQENAGAGAARNRGIDAARGAWIYFLDSDDWIGEHAIEWAVERGRAERADIVVMALAQYHDPSGLYRSTPWLIRADRFPARAFSWRDNPRWIFRAFQNYAEVRLCRTSFIRENGIRFQEIHLTEDLMYAAPGMACAQRICFQPRTAVFNRVGTGADAMEFKDRHPLDFYTAFRTLKGWLEDTGLYPALRDAYIDWAASGCLYNLNTLKTPEMFGMVYRKLNDEIFEALDIAGAAPETFLVEAEARQLRDVQTLSPEAYAMRLLQATGADRERLQFVDSSMHEREGRASAERNALRAEAGAQRSRADELEQQLAACARERDDARNEVAAVRASRSYRLGNLAMAPLARLRDGARKRRLSAPAAAAPAQLASSQR